MAYNGWALAGVILCVFILIGAVFLIYFGLTRKNPPGPPCTSTNQCDPTQQCTGGFCTEIACTLQSDCGPSQICSNGFCFQNSCENNSNCGTGTVCQNGLCIAYGQTCSSNQDCRGGRLSCVNGRCSQCAANVDCPGGICAGDGICYPNCSGIADACPANQTCINDFCCPTGVYPNHCSNSTDCGQGFCVNNACTCGKGTYGDICISSVDCASGLCLAAGPSNGICVNSGNSCFYNFTPNQVGAAYCPATAPFCSNGACSTQSLGAPCVCFESGISANCSEFNSCNLGTSGNTGTSTTYCINSRCSLTPGSAGASCTSNFDCAPVTGLPNCSNGRCV